MKEKKIALNKGISHNVTAEKKFKTIVGDLLVYSKDLKPIGYDNPKITLTVAENVDSFQKGIVKMEVQGVSYYLHIDGILSCIYSGYAKNLNDLRKPTLRQQTVRLKSFLLELADKIFHKK